MRATIEEGVTGLALGFVLSRIGFSSWDEVHQMFLLRDPRLILTFLLCVGILVAGWWVVRRSTDVKWGPRPLHRGAVVGGACFGVGWAICGACPSIALVQLGEGQMGALVILAGIFAGNWLCSIAIERFLRWPAPSCASD